MVKIYDEQTCQGELRQVSVTVVLMEGGRWGTEALWWVLVGGDGVRGPEVK